MRAIFAVDPGGSTGVAWGLFDDTAETVKDAMRSRTMSGSATVHCGRVEGSKQEIQRIVRRQVDEIDQIFVDFTRELDGAKGAPDLEIVAEHFVLTAAPHHKPGVEGIFPAFLLGALMITWQDEEEIILQTASTGMKWNHRKYHDSWTTWIRGREHERAAFAHIGARLMASMK